MRASSVIGPLAMSMGLVVAGCSSDSTASTVTTVTSATVVTDTAPTPTASSETAPPAASPPSTQSPATPPPTTAAPSTVESTTSAPETTGPLVDGAAAWAQDFEALVESGGHVVWADNPGTLAVGSATLGWMFVDTATDHVVTATIGAEVIGAHAMDDGSFVAVTTIMDATTTADVITVAADGSVAVIGSMETQPSIGEVPAIYASIAPRGARIYLNLATAAKAGFPMPGTTAVVEDGAITMLSPTEYGQITFTNAGDLVVTEPGDKRVGGSTENRHLSSDGGASWKNIAVGGADWNPGILLNITPATALTYDRMDPARLGVAQGDGSVAGEFDVDGESVGWVVDAVDGSPTVTLIGVTSGLGITIDRATGAPTTAAAPVFSSAHLNIVAAWTGSDARPHALASAAGCQGICPPTVLLTA